MRQQITPRAKDLAGAAQAALPGPAESNVLTVRNATVAYIDTGATVSAGGDVQVLASETRGTSSSTVLAFSGGIVALQAGVSIVNVGSAMSAYGQSRSPGTESAVDTQIKGPSDVTNFPNDPDGVASAAKSSADARIQRGMNVRRVQHIRAGRTGHFGVDPPAVYARAATSPSTQPTQARCRR